MLAVLLQQFGDAAQGLALVEEALKWGTEIDPELKSGGYILAGWLAAQQEDFIQARRYFEHGLAQAQALNHPVMAGRALAGLAMISVNEGKWHQAATKLAEAEGMLRPVGAWWDLALTLNIHSTLLQLQGDAASAVPLLRESLLLSQDLGDRWAMVFSLEGLAGAAFTLGHLEKAVILFSAAQALREATGTLGYGSHSGRRLIEEQIETLRQQLGRTRWQELTSQGQALSLAEMVSLALDRQDWSETAD